MQKVKILILSDEEQAGLRAVLAEAMAGKNLPMADNISYLSAKLRNSQSIPVPEGYPADGTVQAQLKALAASANQEEKNNINKQHHD